MTALAASLGIGVDRLLGEPPARWHPVVWFGSAMMSIEHRWWADERMRGVAYAATGVAIALAPAMIGHRIVGSSIATVVASSITTAGAMLEREAHGVAHHLDVGDIEAARFLVGRLVGRTTDSLGATDIARAVIETVAENTVDAVTATVFWATVAGTPGALIHRAINTMDAMVGHRTERHRRFGWASARLDDLANWVPARLTTLAVMMSTPTRAGEVWRTVRSDAHRHPSPNGGVVEAAFAAALGIRLGGTNVYADVVDHRGVLGNGRPPNCDDVERATALARRATVVFAVGGVVAQLVVGRLMRRARNTRRSGRLSR